MRDELVILQDQCNHITCYSTYHNVDLFITVIGELVHDEDNKTSTEVILDFIVEIPVDAQEYAQLLL